MVTCILQLNCGSPKDFGRETTFFSKEERLYYFQGHVLTQIREQMSGPEIS